MSQNGHFSRKHRSCPKLLKLETKKLKECFPSNSVQQMTHTSIFDDFPFTFTSNLVLDLLLPSQLPPKQKPFSDLKKNNGTASPPASLDKLPIEILLYILEFCDTLDTVGSLNKFFRNLVHDKLTLACWGLRHLGQYQALMVTIKHLWRESDDKTGGLRLVEYMVSKGADIFCGDNGMWLLKLLEVGKYRLLESFLSRYKKNFLGETLNDNEDGSDDEEKDELLIKVEVRKTIKEIARLAVYKGDPASNVITFLIGKGYKSDMALSKFIKLGNHSVVNFIFKNKDKAPLTKEEIKLAMKFFQYYSSRGGDLDMIRLFLYHCIITVDETGRTPEYPALFAEAIWYQHCHVVDYLASHGLYFIPNSLQTIRKLLRSPPKDGEHIIFHLYQKGYFTLQPISEERDSSCESEWITEEACDFPHIRSLLRFLMQLAGPVFYWIWECDRHNNNRRILVKITSQGHLKSLNHSNNSASQKNHHPKGLFYRF